LWERYFSSVAAPVSSSFLLARLLEIKTYADKNADWVPQLISSTARYIALQKSAAELEAFFLELHIPNADDTETCDSGHQRNEHIRACRVQMHWAQDFLGRLAASTEHIIAREFPNSQKRSNPYLSFAVLMCRFFEGSFNRPGYELVAAITSEVYNRREDDLQSNIEKAYRKDRAGQAEGA
jgi:hypothetical protein